MKIVYVDFSTEINVRTVTAYLNSLFYISGRGGSSGAKFQHSLCLPIGDVMNCADNTGKESIGHWMI